MVESQIALWAAEEVNVKNAGFSSIFRAHTHLHPHEYDFGHVSKDVKFNCVTLLPPSKKKNTQSLSYAKCAKSLPSRIPATQTLSVAETELVILQQKHFTRVTFVNALKDPLPRISSFYLQQTEGEQVEEKKSWNKNEKFWPNKPHTCSRFSLAASSGTLHFSK